MLAIPDNRFPTEVSMRKRFEKSLPERIELVTFYRERLLKAIKAIDAWLSKSLESVPYTARISEFRFTEETPKDFCFEVRIGYDCPDDGNMIGKLLKNEVGKKWWYYSFVKSIDPDPEPENHSLDSSCLLPDGSYGQIDQIGFVELLHDTKKKEWSLVFDDVEW